MHHYNHAIMFFGGGFGQRPAIAQTSSCDIIKAGWKSGWWSATTSLLSNLFIRSLHSNLHHFYRDKAVFWRSQTCSLSSCPSKTVWGLQFLWPSGIGLYKKLCGWISCLALSVLIVAVVIWMFLYKIWTCLNVAFFSCDIACASQYACSFQWWLRTGSTCAR